MRDNGDVEALLQRWVCLGTPTAVMRAIEGMFCAASHGWRKRWSWTTKSAWASRGGYDMTGATAEGEIRIAPPHSSGLRQRLHNKDCQRHCKGEGESAASTSCSGRWKGTMLLKHNQLLGMR